MNTGVLERVRLLEADLEHARDAAVYQQLLPISNARHILLRDHYIFHQQAVMKDTASKLLDAYLEEDELLMAQNEQQTLADAVQEYDAKVAQIREYSRTHNSTHSGVGVGGGPHSSGPIQPVSDAVEYTDPAEDEPDVDAFLSDLFTPVENFGQRLECYESSFNEYSSLLIRCAAKDSGIIAAEKRKLKSVEDFAASIPSAFNLSTAAKLLLPKDYEAFVVTILDYLTNFHKRLRPLEGRLLESEMKAAEGDMNVYWKLLVEASQKHIESGGTASFQPPGRAVKYLPSTWRPHQLLRKIKQLNDQGIVSGGDVEAIEAELRWCEVTAMKEAKVGKLVSGILAEVCTTSESIFRSNKTKMPAEVQREHAYEEEAFLTSLEEGARKKADALSRNLANSRLVDLGHAVDGDGADEDINGFTESSGAHVTTVCLINESGIPLDIDGNEVRIWQRKMQGLDNKFPCEICGGKVYSGDKVYTEHFFDTRHTDGLKRLGIRNSKEFEGTVTIDGAYYLARHIKGNPVLKRARDENLAEELEDNDGLVITRAEFLRLESGKW